MSERPSAENDAATVCIAHGRFIPCRKDGEHRYTSNPFWVKSVNDYQGSADETLTWEPAWERPIPPATPYLCEPCRNGQHWRCAEPGTCQCTEPVGRAHSARGYGPLRLPLRKVRGMARHGALPDPARKPHPMTRLRGGGDVLSPKGMCDLDGWTPITCWQAEIVRRADLAPASSYTDVDKPEVFTEWWSVAGDRIARSVPVLREYRDRDGCRHYLANEPSVSADEEV